MVLYPMELSLLRLQDSPSRGPGERRRRIRHKPHTPAYASFNYPSSGIVLDLSELLDLNEEGFAVQTSHPLEANRPVSMCLELPETKSYIHGTGHVVWSDARGRAGVRFAGLPENSRRQLKQWLFINLLVACTNQAARKQQIVENVVAPTPAPTVPKLVPSPVPDLTGMLSAIEAVRREVRAIGDDLDAAFRLVTERALSLTGGSGAALAFLTGEKMICRANAGEPAPPLGAAVDVKQGVSGECVRTGRLIRCDDTETDSRVEPDLCRVLGIGSILAAPIFSDFRVVGLLEVFSPRAHAFTDVHETALDRLVEIVPKAKAEPVKVDEPKTSPVAAPAEAKPQDIREQLWEPERVAEEPLKGIPVRPWHLILLFLAAGAVCMALGYLLQPRIEAWWRAWTKSSPALQSVSADSSPHVVSARTGPKTLEELRKMAELGDAEAQWDLGSIYHNGTGVPQDDTQAVQWFLRAAEQGHVTAQGSLGAYYWAGRGVPEDLSKAYFWSVLAMAQGDETSRFRVEGLAARMTRAQIESARQQAEEWLRQHHAKAAGK